jgi:hypothetical protein
VVKRDLPPVITPAKRRERWYTDELIWYVLALMFAALCVGIGVGKILYG